MKLSIEKLQELLPDLKLDRRKKNLVGKCPYCSENSFGISLEDNHLFGCYRKKRCGITGNIFILAKFLGKLSLLNIEGDVGKVDKLQNKILKEDIQYNLELPTVSMPIGWKRVMQDDYLDSRGFIEYEKYKVGRTIVDPRFKKNYIITAIEDGGLIKGYIGRHIWDKEKIKIENEKRKASGEREILRYINSDTDFSKLLFGYDEITENTTTIICTEGIFDKWGIDRLLKLHNQEIVKCNATFKCDISPEQIIKWQNKGITTLILFYDSDVINQIKKAAAELQLYFNILIAFNETGSDPGEITEEELSVVFSNLKSVSDFSSNKVVSTLK